MKSILFGNSNADWWKLLLVGVSAEEQIVAINGELQAGFFRASTPMCVAPAALARFAAEIRQLDQTLTGAATLENQNNQSAVKITLTANHVGHIILAGRYEINDNVLHFSFQSDQTQLAPLARWLESAVTKYERNST
jgi:hypothetical protein